MRPKTVADAFLLLFLIVACGIGLLRRQGSGAADALRGPDLSGPDQDRLRMLAKVIPPEYIREVAREYVSLSTPELLTERELLHGYFHELRREIAELDRRAGRGLLVKEYQPGDDLELHLATGMAPNGSELPFPSYVDWRTIDGRLAAFVVPLPYETNPSFWEVKARLELVEAILGRAVPANQLRP